MFITPYSHHFHSYFPRNRYSLEGKQCTHLYGQLNRSHFATKLPDVLTLEARHLSESEIRRVAQWTDTLFCEDEEGNLLALVHLTWKRCAHPAYPGHAQIENLDVVIIDPEFEHTFLTFLETQSVDCLGWFHDGSGEQPFSCIIQQGEVHRARVRREQMYPDAAREKHLLIR